MSELAELTGVSSTNTTALPGYVISRWRLNEIGEAEIAFEEDHLARVANSVASASPGVRDAMVENAQSLIGLGIYNHGASGFIMKLYAKHMLPMLLRLSVRQTQPQMTDAAASLLVTQANTDRIITAIREAAWLGLKPQPLPNAAGAELQIDPAPPSEAAR